MSTPTATTRRREVVRHAIVEATVELLLDRGLDVTVDDIAEHANIGRRTIFRYFATKDELFAEAAASWNRSFEEAISPRAGREVGEWLDSLARAVHAKNLRMARTYLAIEGRKGQLPWVAKFEAQPDRPTRLELLRPIADEAWLASGGRGRAPRSVADSLVLHLSVFASEALRMHCRHDVDQMARLTVTTLLVLMREERAAAARRRAKRR